MSHDQESDYRNPPQELPDDGEILFDEQQSNDQIPLQEIPEDYEVPSKKEEDDDQILPQAMRKNDGTLFED